jgi:hypothetical protein
METFLGCLKLNQKILPGINTGYFTTAGCFLQAKALQEALFPHDDVGDDDKAILHEMSSCLVIDDELI